MQNLSLKSISKSMSFISSVTFLTVLLGIITTKIIAVFGGLEVMGTLEIYRKLIGVLVPLLAAGTGTIIVQKISNSINEKDITNIISATLVLLLIQLFLIIILIIFFADDIAALIFFNSNENIKATSEMRVVIVMAYFILISQTFTALINGKVNLKKVSIVNIASAFTTMLASYPLLFLEDLGIALLVGFGSIVGSIIAIYYVIKIYKKNISFVGFNFKSLLTSFPASIWMVAHPLVVSTLLLLIPIIINNHYGLKALGLFSSATIITAVVTMVLMSAMKTYFLPTLGTIESLVEKKFFINKIIFFCLIIILPIIIFTMFFAKFLLFILFSEEFIGAYKLLIVQMMSVLTAAFCWPYANYILHNGNFKAYFIIDTIWASILALMLFYVAGKDYDLIVVPIIFVIGSFLSLALYAFAVKFIYGEGFLSKKNLIFGIYSVLIMLLTYIVVSEFSLFMQSFWAFLLAIGFILLIRRQNVKNLWNT